MRHLEIGRGEDAEPQVPERPGDLQRAVTGYKRLIQLAEHRVCARHERADTASPVIVVQPFSEGLGLAQALQHSTAFAELEQHRPQLEADLEALLQHGLALRQRREDLQRLLEPGSGIRECRPSHRLESGLAEIVNCLLSQLAAEGVVSETLHVFGQTFRIKRFNGIDDPRMEDAPALREQAPVRNLLRERVFESVLEIREELRLVEKFRGLEVGESLAKSVIRKVGDCLEEWPGNVLANDGGGLEQPLVLGPESVDPSREYGLHGCRDLDGFERARELIGSTLAYQHTGFNECPHALFKEKGIGLGAADQHWRERGDGWVRAEKRLEQLRSVCRWEGVQVNLGVAGLAAPAVGVLRPVDDEKEVAGGG